MGLFVPLFALFRFCFPPSMSHIHPDPSNKRFGRGRMGSPHEAFLPLVQTVEGRNLISSSDH